MLGESRELIKHK